MPCEVILTVNRLTAACKKNMGIVFTDKNGNIIDNNTPKHQYSEITGVNYDPGQVTNYGPNPIIHYGPISFRNRPKQWRQWCNHRNNDNTEAITGVRNSSEVEDTGTYSHALSASPEMQDNYTVNITGVPKYMDQEDRMSGDDITDEGTMQWATQNVDKGQNHMMWRYLPKWMGQTESQTWQTADSYDEANKVARDNTTTHGYNLSPRPTKTQ